MPNCVIIDLTKVLIGQLTIFVMVESPKDGGNVGLARGVSVTCEEPINVSPVNFVELRSLEKGKSNHRSQFPAYNQVGAISLQEAKAVHFTHDQACHLLFSSITKRVHVTNRLYHRHPRETVFEGVIGK